MKERKCSIFKLLLVIVGLLAPICMGAFASHAEYVEGEDGTYLQVDMEYRPDNYVGETTPLCTAQVGSFLYTSEAKLIKATIADTSIARVSYRDSIYDRTYLITGLKAGTTSLKIEYRGLVAYAPVKVKAAYTRLSTKSITMYPKQVTSISFYLEGHGALKTSEFRSSNKKVATFTSSGVIKTKKVGKAKLSFKANGKKLSFTVRVIPRPPKVSQLKTKVEHVSYANRKCDVRVRFTNKSKFRITKIKVRLTGYINEKVTRTVTVKNINLKPGKSMTKILSFGISMDKLIGVKAKVLSFSYK